METRIEDLSKLRTFTEEIDKDLTLILQSLQWDRKHILQHSSLVTCKHDSNHRMLSDKIEEHEQQCLLRHNGYSSEDNILPEPLDLASGTLVKLSKQDIQQIISNASKLDPTFKKGIDRGELEPQTLDRLQSTYTNDERRAIHDAVVNAVPSCHDLTDLALSSTGDNEQTPKIKSRTEILAELRDMRRRRTKYRVASKSSNYSHVLRDLIKTQMDLYQEAIGDNKTDNVGPNSMEKQDVDSIQSTANDKEECKRDHPRHEIRDKYSNQSRREVADRDVIDNRQNSREQHSRDQHSRDRRNRERSKEKDSYRHSYRHYSNDNTPTTSTFEDNGRGKAHRDRSQDTRHRSRSNSRHHDAKCYKYRSGHAHKERDSSYDSHRSKHVKEPGMRYTDKDRHKGQETQYTDRHKDLSNEERAQNLITEIKREIDDNYEHGENDSTIHTSSIEINQEKMYRDYLKKSNTHHEQGTNKSYRYSEKKDRSREPRNSNDGYTDYDRYRERKHDNERKESNLRVDIHKKYKDEPRKERRRDRDSEKEVKKSLTEHKHRLYGEIYSELDKKKHNKFK